MKKCKLLLDLPNVFPGWGCCKCKTYNNIQRVECKICSHERCDGSVIINQPEIIINQPEKDSNKWN